MSVVAPPSQPLTLPPMAAEVRIAPQRAQGIHPPGGSQMMLATAPLFHPSEVHLEAYQRNLLGFEARPARQQRGL